MYYTTITRSMLHANAWLNGTKPTWSFAMIENLLGALPPIEDIWASLPDLEAIALLQRIFPPNLKCEKPVKELNLLHKSCLLYTSDAADE